MSDAVKTCERCCGPLTIGPFYAKCQKCDPFYFQRCGICGALRVECCC